MCDGNVNSNRKWPVSHALTPALSPSCWSVRTHKQAHTDESPDTHAHTAGLPVSGDLGWASEAPHGFHIHSSPPRLPSELVPSSSLFILSLPPSSFTSHLSFHSLSPQPQSDESVEPKPVSVSRFHLSRQFRDSDVRVNEANINDWDLSKRSGSEHSLGALLCSAGLKSWSEVPQIQIAPFVSQRHRNILPRTLIRDPTCFRDSLRSAFQSETGCRLADSAVSHQWWSHSGSVDIGRCSVCVCVFVFEEEKERGCVSVSQQRLW